MTSLSDNLYLLTPEFALAGLAFLVFTVDLLLPEGRKIYLAWLSMAGLIALMVVSLVMLWDEQESLYDGLLAVDDFSLFFKVLFMGIGVFIIPLLYLLVRRHLSRKQPHAAGTMETDGEEADGSGSDGDGAGGHDEGKAQPA